ncbi:MAG TPA: sugar phosphate nucleotidyltransferase [Candidatus Bathyarchaeia archaeon]|nr:sugar phosphate nucleotidyltransferase [Candidatus Bathyarchaeia archaeon]
MVMAIDGMRVRRPWAVVLAGGEGVRLQPLVRWLYGEDRPKQFCALLGKRTLLRQTLDRVGLAIPPERTLVIGLESHAQFLAGELGEPDHPLLLMQPESRGTAAAVLLAAQWIESHDPGATVVFFPSDQFVSEDTAFMKQVFEVARFVQEEPRWTVLLGVQPDEAETEYGWIEPGTYLASRGHWPLYRVRRFLEKPSRQAAQTLLRDGCLWNTFVFASTSTGLLAAGRECVPMLTERLAGLTGCWDGARQEWAVRHAYAGAPTVSFSRSVLESCSRPLAVSKVSGLTWRDLGSPSRALRTMNAVGERAAWHPVVA